MPTRERTGASACANGRNATWSRNICRSRIRRHGGDSGEGRVLTNGLTLAAPFGGGGTSTLTYDVANAEEMQVLVSGGLGEAETGGPSINMASAMRPS